MSSMPETERNDTTRPAVERRGHDIRVLVTSLDKKVVVRMSRGTSKLTFSVPTRAYCTEVLGARVKEMKRSQRRAIARAQIRARDWRAEREKARRAALRASVPVTSEPGEMCYRVAALLASHAFGGASAQEVEVRLTGAIAEVLGNSSSVPITRALMTALSGKAGLITAEEQEAAIRSAMTASGLVHLDLIDLALADVRHSLRLGEEVDLDLNRPVEWVREDEGVFWWREYAAPTLRARATADQIAKYYRDQIVTGFACQLRERQQKEAEVRAKSRREIATRLITLSTGVMSALAVSVVFMKAPQEVQPLRETGWDATVLSDPIITGSLPEKAPEPEQISFFQLKQKSPEGRMQALRKSSKASTVRWSRLEIKCKTRQIHELAAGETGPDDLKPVQNSTWVTPADASAEANFVDMACKS